MNAREDLIRLLRKTGWDGQRRGWRRGWRRGTEEDGKGAGDYGEGDAVIPETILAGEEEGARTHP